MLYTKGICPIFSKAWRNIEIRKKVMWFQRYGLPLGNHANAQKGAFLILTDLCNRLLHNWETAFSLTSESDFSHQQVVDQIFHREGLAHHRTSQCFYDAPLEQIMQLENNFHTYRGGG